MDVAKNEENEECADDMFENMPLTEETTCGFWFIKGPLLQKAANKKMYVLLYGLLGCFYGATYAYFNGTMTTLEKRFKIPSRISGLIAVGNDISLIPASLIISYYGGKGHRPRWISFGTIIMLIFCILSALPHFLWGPGEDALQLTKEYGGGLYANITDEILGLTYFLRMLGPAFGFALASFCLNIFVSPNLTPTIDNKDPRWIGAWWMGWLVLSTGLTVFSMLMALFPKTLPRAAVRRAIALEKMKGLEKKEEPPSVTDLVRTLKRLLKNKLFLFNNLSSIFYCLGYNPYWTYLPKYIEIQYKQSASVSNFATGTVGLVFSAIGVLVSGSVVSKFRPSARVLGAWSMAESVITVVALISYMGLGCDTPDLSSSVGEFINDCNIGCHCEYTPYSPVCYEEKVMFISPCHTGCNSVEEINGTKFYGDCSCTGENRTVKDGPCPTDCTKPFYIFLAMVCLCKFVGATSRSANFLINMRCVEEKDKSTAIGFSLTIVSLFAFVPSPILFGYIIDTTCLVWGKTCTGTGNCWLYDDDQLRKALNTVAVVLVSIGALFDIAIWYYVKDLKMFDDATSDNKKSKGKNIFNIFS